DVAIKRKQNIVQLQVTINNAVVVEIFQSQADFGCIKSALYKLAFGRKGVGRSYWARLEPNWPLWMCSIKSPPLIYSMTKYTRVSVWKQACKLSRNGCRSLLAIKNTRFSDLVLSTSSFSI